MPCKSQWEREVNRFPQCVLHYQIPRELHESLNHQRKSTKEMFEARLHQASMIDMECQHQLLYHI